MGCTPVRRLPAFAVVAGLVLGLAPAPLRAQGGILKGVIKAVEDAKKAADAAKKAADDAARRKAGAPGTPAASGAQPGTAPAPAIQAGPVPRSSAKVVSQVMLTGQTVQQMHYVLSPKGQHVAAITLRGSRDVLTYDGVDGPVFDEVLKGDDASRPLVTFSEDGSRYAYVGRRGQEFVFMVDGKEFATFPVSALLAQNQPSVDLADRFGTKTTTTAPIFTPGGRHVMFAIVTPMPNGNKSMTLYVDGKPGPTSTASPWINPVVSPDGEHHAYALYGAGQSALVVDGKLAAWRGDSPVFTGDSKHLITTLGNRSGGTDVQLDGKPWFGVAGSVHLYAAPMTDLVVGAVSGARPEDGWWLEIGGKKVPGSDVSAVANVWFNPDGRHWAAACRSRGGVQFMMVDGKKGLDYQSVEGIAFTPDGRWIYKAVMPGQKQFIVRGDQESDAYQRIVPLSKPGVGPTSGTDVFSTLIAGNHVGFMASASQSLNTAVVVVDGKATPVAMPGDLTFNADGSHVAYTTNAPAHLRVVADGKEQGTLNVTQNSAMPKLVFSADGTHLAFAATSPERGARGVSVDGTFISYAEQPVFPMNDITFTPDGAHLIWVAASLPRGRAAVYVDGVKALELQSSGLELQQSGFTDDTRWSMGADGVLTFVAHDGDSLKRFQITPGSDTSVATMKAIGVLR